MRRALLLCGLLAASCTPTHPYTLADRETFEAVAPEYKAYVEADPALSPEAKILRMTALETWRMRIEAAEGK